MKPIKKNYQLPLILIIFITTGLYSCINDTLKSAKQPTLSDYSVGEKWVWKYKGVTTEGEVRSEGEDTRAVISADGVLGMLIGNDTIPVKDIVKPEASDTPKYDWPLEVGKTWTYEKNWTSQDGTTGSQRQDAKVLSYKEETVAAGTFMAYTIEYKGTVSNSRGYNAQTDDVWLYAPDIKNFIKMTQTQDDFLYEEELKQYTNPNNK